MSKSLSWKLLKRIRSKTCLLLTLFCESLSTISGNRTNAPFGAITGYASSNVPAYSNGNDSYISDQFNCLYGVYTGIKWQCVEYARRWLFIHKGCVFGDVDGAADIWNLTTVQRVVDQKIFIFKSHPNGSPSPPQNESLVIYTRSSADIPYGHVSVIVDVLPDYIRVAEENYDPYYWSGNYSRQIPYVLRQGMYYIEDNYPIFGWMTVEDDNQTKPLDQSIIDQIIQLKKTSPDLICLSNANYYTVSIYCYVLVIFLYLI